MQHGETVMSLGMTVSKADMRRGGRMPGFPLMLVRLAALFLTFLTLTAEVGGAFAHASLVGSEPADGAALASPPPRILLDFNEPVAPQVLKLVRPGGGTEVIAGYERHGNAIIIPMPADVGPGSYALSWRVISEDGHPVGGTLVFAVGGAVLAHAADDVSAGPALDAMIWIFRVALYVGLFFGVGGAVFHAFVAETSAAARRIAAAFLAIGLLAAPVSLGLLGLDALAQPVSAFLRTDVWAAALGTSYARTIAAAVLSLAAALVSLRTRRDGILSRLAAALAWAGVALAPALSGHASTAPPEILTRPAVALHAGALVFWLGALLPLATLLRRGGTDGGKALARFSHAIPWAVAPLVVSGLVLASIQVGAPAALWSTGYGAVLLAKLALISLLLALAAFNRWRLTSRAGRGDSQAVRRLAALIAVEMALVVAVLGIVALWRFTPPPRALAASAAPFAHMQVHLHGPKAMAMIELSPDPPGPVAVTLTLTDAALAPLAAKEVEVALSNAAAGIEPIRRQARPAGAIGIWTVDDLQMPVAGHWTIRVGILVSDFERLFLEGYLDVPGQN